MTGAGIPLIVLGGSDRQASVLPPEGEGKHPLTGFKGVDIVLAGRPLVCHVVERFRVSGLFDPVTVAGPRQHYDSLPGVGDVIDTDGSLVENIMTALEFVQRDRQEGPIAITTCDILPSPEDLAEVIEHYAEHRQSDVYYPLIRVPEDREELGAFGWKPTYRFVPRRGAQPVRVLPGHLVIVDPSSLRLALVWSLTKIAYRTRNRPIGMRRSSMLRQILFGLLYHDLLHLLALRVPNLTYSVLRNGFKVATGLRKGNLLLSELEKACGQIFIRWRHRKRHPDRGVHCPILEGMSLAADIDTEEEARQLGAETGD